MMPSQERSHQLRYLIFPMIVSFCMSLFLALLLPQAVYSYAFDSYGGLKDRWGLPQPENRRWSDASFTWWYDETTEPSGFSGHQNDARTGMNYWSLWSNVAVSVTEAASSSAADILISWDSTVTALAVTSPNITGGNLVGAQIRFNPAESWTTPGFLDVIQHEFGHALGLVDMYDDATNTVIDFVDHPAGGDKAGKPTNLMADNVMYGYGSASASLIRLFDNDDMYGANWLFGGSINTIATAAWETALGSDPKYLNYYKVADHHGAADGTPEHIWRYATSIGSSTPDNTLIEIEAYGVWAASIAGENVAGWTIDILDDMVRYTGPGGFTGNLLLELTSSFSDEALLPAKVNFVNFDQYPGEGRQFWPRIWTPVPEPSTLVLLGSGLAGLLWFGRKKLFGKA